MKWKMFWTSLGILFLVTVLTAGGYVWHMYRSVEKTASQIYKPIAHVKGPYVSQDPEVPPHPAAPKSGGQNPFTMLIMGSDERADERGRADTLILLGINPKSSSVLMFSVPRDSLTDIAGKGTRDKINHAYAFGGVSQELQTVERFVDYPIDYYVHVDMKGFAKVIDLIGGVEVYNKAAFRYGAYTFPQGKVRLSGAEALAFTRMRKQDPQGDFGRNDRQKDVIRQLIAESTKMKNITRLDSLIKEAGNDVTTNMTFADMKKFLTEYRGALKRFETDRVHGTGKMIGGIWYYIVGSDERNRLHDTLKKHQQSTEDQQPTDLALAGR